MKLKESYIIAEVIYKLNHTTITARFITITAAQLLQSHLRTMYNKPSLLITKN